jgi:sugar phosphate isomerase/epimerase
MAAPGRRLFGCNVIDPQLRVKGGTDYSLAITERSLAFLRDIGHRAVEYSHACHWSVGDCAAVREMTLKLGLVPWSLHAWAGWDILRPDGRAETLAMLSTAVRNAQALGVGIVVHHPHGRNLDSEAELLRQIARPGVRFALENMQTLASMEYAVALADGLGPEVAGICVDTGHAALGDLGPARAIRLGGSRLITTHLQDNRGSQDDHLPPGDGTIDWDAVAEALREVGYGGCVMLELTDQPSTEARRADIREELKRGARAAQALAARLPAV